jgi:hypothetical protein
VGTSRLTRACTRQGAEVWPSPFAGGQSLRRALQVKPGVSQTDNSNGDDMSLRHRAEWQLLRPASEEATRDEARREARKKARATLLAELIPARVDEVLAISCGEDLVDASTAIQFLFGAFSRQSLPAEWHTPTAEATKALIRRLEFGSGAWMRAHALLDGFSGAVHSFLDEDLASRNLTRADYELNSSEISEERKEALARLPLDRPLEQCMDDILGDGGLLNGATRSEAIAWASAWRAERSAAALSSLRHRLQGRVKLQALINLLGPPDDADYTSNPGMAYYSVNKSSGLILHADNDGYIRSSQFN